MKLTSERGERRARETIALLWVACGAVFAACGVPALDRAGQIRCGSDRAGGGCPEGFSCRFGRCCPSGAAPETCPTSIASDGSVKCSPTRECPVGTVCSFDRCCPTDASGTGLCTRERVGAPCDTDASCGGARTGLRCFLDNTSGTQRAPGGYCTRATACNPTDPASCGDGGVCVEGVCYGRCIIPSGTIAAPCRTDPSGMHYTCRRISADATTTDGVCVMDCSATAASEAAVCHANATCTEGVCSARCRTNTECPSVRYACESGACAARFIPCSANEDCNEAGDAMPSFVCRPHPAWMGPNPNVCVLARPTACAGTAPCLDPIRVEGGIVRFPCIQGLCVVRVEPTAQ